MTGGFRCLLAATAEHDDAARQLPRECELQDLAKWLKEQLDYEFSDERLLVQALTHRSAGSNNNERLEFLGDAVLDLVVSDVVYGHRPASDEGELSRLRASLVRKSTLVELAKHYSVGEQLILGAGERRSGGHQRASILADALEAVFGAVYLDGGIEEARRMIHRVFAERFTTLPDAEGLKDAKTRLQEWLQAAGMSLPDYATVQVSGKAHRQQFEVSCSVSERDQVTVGSGVSRRRAEQAAAAAMLKSLRAD